MSKQIVSFFVFVIALCSFQIGFSQIIINPNLVNQHNIIVPSNLQATIFQVPTEKKVLSKMSFLMFFEDTDPTGLDPTKGCCIQGAEPQEKTFSVTSTGFVSAKFSVLRIDTNGYNLTINLKLINPLGETVDAINLASLEPIKTGTGVKTFTLNGYATAQTSGCTANTNTWKVVVTPPSSKGRFEVTPEVTIPTTTSTRTVFPDGGYTLNANAFGDFAFASPKNAKGQLEITVTSTGTTPLEVRLFKPGVVPAANEANAIVTKTFTTTSNTFKFTVSATDQPNATDFWKIRLRNKGSGTQVISNAKVTVKFSSCY